MIDFEYIETDDEEIEKLAEDEQTDPDFMEQHNKNAYMQVGGACPSCDRLGTLEYQVMGYEKEVFCTACPYHRTIILRL